MIAAIFGDLNSQDVNRDFLMSRANLTPKNKDVAEVNVLMINQFPGDCREFKSADTVDDPEDQIAYPPELLNSLNPSDLPPHELKLKVGCPVMLLLNLNARNGLCNGTRLIVRSFQQYVLEAEIATCPKTGTIVLIPRISLTPSPSRCPIQAKRTQFPVRLAFSMTINKAQGQTFDTIGLYLPDPPFTHGLLYVTMSCVPVPAAIRIMLNPESPVVQGQPGHTTRSIVYQ